MAQQTTNWWFAGYIADQFDSCRIEAHRYGDGLVFLGREDWLEFDIALQNLAAGSVYAAYGRPELPVWVGRNVFFQKIHKPAIALQQSQHLDRPVGRFRARLVTSDLWRGRSHLCGGGQGWDLFPSPPPRLPYRPPDPSLQQQRRKT